MDIEESLNIWLRRLMLEIFVCRAGKHIGDKIEPEKKMDLTQHRQWKLFVVSTLIHARDRLWRLGSTVEWIRLVQLPSMQC